MATARNVRIGLVATGQGPRLDYVRFHGSHFAKLGLQADISVISILDGLTRSQISDLAPTDDEEATHCYVPNPEASGPLAEDAWYEAYLSKTKTIPLINRAIERLERSENVDLTIFCCGEAYPEGTIVGSKFVVLPAEAVKGTIRWILAGRAGQLKLGLLAGGARQRSAQERVWQDREFASRVVLDVEDASSDPAGAVRRLVARGAEVVVWWGYGAGVESVDPSAPDEPLGPPMVPMSVVSEVISSVQGAALVLPNLVSILTAASVLWRG
jgi:hypothetical protein